MNGLCSAIRAARASGNANLLIGEFTPPQNARKTSDENRSLLFVFNHLRPFLIIRH